MIPVPTIILALTITAGLFTPETPRRDDVPNVDTSDRAADFTLVDTYGTTHRLSDYHGKYVVLEWLNYDCPFVRKHYGSGNMQRLQKKYTEKGVVWLSIVSSAPGKQGHFPPDEMNNRTAQHGGAQTAVLLDTDGVVGRRYSARTTPHMFVIDPTGHRIYEGAIDDKPTTDTEDIDTATNFVGQALDQAMAGEPVTVTARRPYGCAVKY